MPKSLKLDMRGHTSLCFTCNSRWRHGHCRDSKNLKLNRRGNTKYVFHVQQHLAPRTLSMARRARCSISVATPICVSRATAPGATDIVEAPRACRSIAVATNMCFTCNSTWRRGHCRGSKSLSLDSRSHQYVFHVQQHVKPWTLSRLHVRPRTLSRLQEPEAR